MAHVAIAASAVDKVLSQTSKILDNVSEYTFENEIMFAVWNDWKGRDSRARIERTYNHGRWSYEKRTLGFVNGRWYCCLKTEAAKAKGLKLDR